MCVLDTLWIQSISGQLLSEAEDGWLWWVPSEAIDRMVDVGLYEICGRYPALTQRLKFSSGRLRLFVGTARPGGVFCPSATTLGPEFCGV